MRSWACFAGQFRGVSVFSSSFVWAAAPGLSAHSFRSIISFVRRISCIAISEAGSVS